MQTYINDIFDIFDIKKTQLNIMAVKSLICAMIEKEMCYKNKQKLIFDENTFKYCWMVYQECLIFFDDNYNRKTDFSLFFKYIIDSMLKNKGINFHALFCPGYTKNGYKSYLGKTTIWKLKALNDIVCMLNENDVSATMMCYYSDVFLENCDSQLEPDWMKQLICNRDLFHMEAEKYFENSEIKNASSVDVFSKEGNSEGYIDYKLIDRVKKTTYDAFVKSNRNFYNSMGFNEEQMKFRNDRLITMYMIFSDYLNSLDNSVFLPMENMYERENIFSENGTCTMYLKLKRK